MSVSLDTHQAHEDDVELLGSRAAHVVWLENDYASGYAGYLERLLSAHAGRGRLAIHRVELDRWHATHDHDDLGRCQA